MSTNPATISFATIKCRIADDVVRDFARIVSPPIRGVMRIPAPCDHRGYDPRKARFCGRCGARVRWMEYDEDGMETARKDCDARKAAHDELVAINPLFIWFLLVLAAAFACAIHLIL